MTSIPHGVEEVFIGRIMGACLDRKKTVWVFGENSKGELGVGDKLCRINPYPLVALEGKRVTKLAIGSYFTIALTD